MDIQQFESRKRDHIHHALALESQAKGFSGLDHLKLHHEALPDLNFDEISLQAECLGLGMKTPFYVAGMTAGHETAVQLNHCLAQACMERGWAMGVGSQRRDLEALQGKSNIDGVDAWQELRRQHPQLVLFANIGLSQVIRTETAHLKKLVNAIEAQALVIHTNPLQEALQVEGTPQFRGSLQALERVVQEISCPVVLKETGCGFSSITLKKLNNLGLAAVDVSGLGGTHWGRIEGARAQNDWMRYRASVTFANWGESTVDSVREAVREVSQKTQIWASGGVRSGLDAAKLIALGAHRVGYAQPALEAALVGPQELSRWMEQQEFELRVALFCTGSGDLESLRQKEMVWKISAN